MLHWLRYPFLRFTPVFAAGILLFEFLRESSLRTSLVTLVTLATFLAILVVVIIILISGRRFFSLNPVIGASTLFSFLILGFLVAETRFQLNWNNHFSVSDFTQYEGVVINWPERKGDFTRVTVRVHKIRQEGNWISSDGKVQVYIRDNKKQGLKYGSRLIVNGKPGPLRGPRNPFEFDYRKYLERKNVFHYQFIDGPEFVIAGKANPNPLKAQAWKFKMRADSVLNTHIKNTDQLTIARAMILGLRGGMDDQIKEAYSHAGAMHILAISGLHVGILYGFLALVLAPLRRHRYGKFASTVIILTILWAYAMLVGLSASVLRATVMFSLISIGNVFYRSPDIFNTIAFSAFLLLLFDPFQLFDIGFQLSYLAVCGIVLIYRNINSWVSSKYRLVNGIWSITSVAIAAQLMTFPLAIHYFHNFPNLFFLSNLIVIPSALVILSAAIGLFISVTASIGLFTSIFTGILSGSLEFMNSSVSLIENIPYSHFSAVSLPQGLTILVYLVIIAALAVFLLKRVIYVYLLSGFWVALFIILGFSQVRKQNRKYLILYDIPGTTLIDFIGNGEVRSFRKAPKGRDDVGYYVSNARIALAGTNVAAPTNGEKIMEGLDLFVWANGSLACLDQGFNAKTLIGRKIRVDILLIRNNAIEDEARILEVFDPVRIVLDSSNGYIYSQKMEEKWRTKGYNIYNIRESGGLIVDM